MRPAYIDGIRRLVVVASACLLLTAVACGGSSEKAVDPAGSPSGDDEIRLVPAQAPDGLPLCLALDRPPSESPTPTKVPTIWGDGGLADPWTGPLVGIRVLPDDDLPVHDDAVEVTVQGVDGYVAPMPLFQAVSSEAWGHIVTWRDASGMVLEVAFRGATPAEVLRVAELVSVNEGSAPSLPPDSLAPVTEVIYQGVGVVPYPLSANGEWSLSYRPKDLVGAEDPRLLTVSGLPGEPQDLQMLRFWAVTTQPLEVRGHEGWEYAAFDAASGPFGAAWQESPGLIVQVSGFGFDPGAIREIIGSLEEVDGDGWKATKDDAANAGCG